MINGLNIVKLTTVSAPQPFMRPDAAGVYLRLRNEIAASCGFDFLGRCGDIFRDAGFVSRKDGVANRSWHKCAVAFDYDQNSNALVLVSEPIGGKQYFRTYLKCSDQHGKLGARKTLRDMRGYSVTAWVVDFTAIAESMGFKRIPAWNGWKSNYNRREFWHYQYNPAGLTWDAAMLELRGKSRPAALKVLGLNDRDDDVRKIQARLEVLGLLPKKEIDGVYGAKTKSAVAKFQTANNLDVDGLVGPLTRAKLLQGA